MRAARAVAGVAVCVLLAALAAPLTGSTASAAERVSVPPVPRAVHTARVRPASMAQASMASGRVLASLRLRGQQPGQMRSLASVLVAGAPDQSVVAFGSKVTCSPPRGRLWHQLWNGTNLVRGRRDDVVRLRTLVEVPPSGDLDCQLRGYLASDVGVPGAHAALRGGWFVDLGSAGPSSATKQRVLSAPANRLVPLGGTTVSERGLSGYVPPSTARALRVTADVYVTECHRRGGFCPRPRDYPVVGTSVAEVWVVATPRARSSCRTWRSRPVRAVIDSHLHHERVESTLVVPVQGASCGPWDISVRARSAGGTTPFVLSLRQPYSAVTVGPQRR